VKHPATVVESERHPERGIVAGQRWARALEDAATSVRSRFVPGIGGVARFEMVRRRAHALLSLPCCIKLQRILETTCQLGHRAEVSFHQCVPRRISLFANGRPLI
jgi:hypothetical protein